MVNNNVLVGQKCKNILIAEKVIFQKINQREIIPLTIIV